MNQQAVDQIKAQRDALAAENKVLREALEGVMPWVVTQEFACHGMKCREALCQSCSTETEEAAERAIAASSVAYSALTKEATNV